jgi:hypothetical protein
MEHYIDASIIVRNSKLVSSNIVKGRRIVLYNIGLSLTQEGNEPIQVSVEYPKLSPLIDLIKLNHDHDEYTYVDGKWELYFHPTRSNI